MRAVEVLKALSRTFDQKEYVLLSNVRNGTGYTKQERYADALALSLWPSKGIELHGFEIKVSRGDWLNELKQPEKSHEIGRFCHRWWIATPPGIVKIEEVPQLWGLIEVGEKKNTKKVVAPLRSPEPWDAVFVASIFRRFGEELIPRAEAELMANERVKAFQEDASKVGEMQYSLRLAESARDSAERELKTLRERVRAFQEASGIDIPAYTWELGKIGTALRAFMNERAGLRRDAGGLSNLGLKLVEIAKELQTFAEKDPE